MRLGSCMPAGCSCSRSLAWVYTYLDSRLPRRSQLYLPMRTRRLTGATCSVSLVLSRYHPSRPTVWALSNLDMDVSAFSCLQPGRRAP